MTHDEFVGHVQNRARLASRAAAEASIRATLETLAERLEQHASEKLAAQLPAEIGRHLRGDRAVEFTRFSMHEFFQRVCNREGESVDAAEAAYHARVVMEVLGEAVTPGAVEKVRAALPEEFGPLFEAGSKGRMSLEHAKPSP